MAAKINKDLILREKLALQRTVMANQTTLLAFLRTAMYFLVAGLSIQNLLDLKGASQGVIIGLYAVAALLLGLGLLNYRRQQRAIKDSERHIGNYQLEYYEDDN